MRLHIHHATRYRYTDPTVYSIQHLRITPREDLGQSILHWRVTAPGHPRKQQDAHGNTVHTLALTNPHQEFMFVVDGEIETQDEPTLLPRGDGLSPLAYLADSPLAAPDEAITAFARASFPAGPRRAALTALMQAVGTRIRCTDDGQASEDLTAAQAFARGMGDCHDLAHIFVACCRALNIPARYVCGYRFSESSGSSHAWADAWLDDENGWLACDVAHRCLADGHLLRLAAGRDHLDAGPLRSLRRGSADETMEIRVLAA